MINKITHIHIILAAACFIFLCSPLESINISEFDETFSIVKLSAIFLFIVWFFTKPTIEANIFIILYIFYALYNTISIFWALNPETSLSKVLSFLFPTILLCAIISKQLNTKKDLIAIAISYVIGAIILSIYAFSIREQLLISASFSDQERLTALNQDPNEFAVLLDLSIAILLHFLGASKKIPYKVGIITLIAIISYIILSTGSRTGFVILISIITLFLISNKKNIPVYFLLFFICGLFILKYIPLGILERLLETGQSIKEQDLTNRVDIWKMGIEAFQNENMILGVGYYNWTEMMSKYYNWAASSHNTYLSALVGGGFFGYIFFLLIIYNILKYSYKIILLEKNTNILLYIIPIFLAMSVLETQQRRWLFLLGIIVYKYYIITKKEIEGNVPSPTEQ